MHYATEKTSNVELLTELVGDARIAHTILCREDNALDYLADCTEEELAQLPGIGIAKARRLTAAVEIGKRVASRPKSNRVHIYSPSDIADIFMPDMRGLKQECFRVLLLNVKNEIMAIEEVSVGNINSSVADPREVFRPAIRRGSASVILAHNHPSGNPEPSGADIEATKRLIDAGDILGVKVIDHIVIGDGTFVSMRQDKLI
jgi:DNA repair protein RadC